MTNLYQDQTRMLSSWKTSWWKHHEVIVMRQVVTKLLEDANEPNGTGTCEEAIMVSEGAGAGRDE